tara:strand:+ start:4106 stop:5824 length:1719 start_codon:yes stop_codon:yes gene_type:complete
MYLARKKEEYTEILKATTVEAQTNLELEMFRRKQLMQLLQDLKQQGDGLRAMNAKLVSGDMGGIDPWKLFAARNTVDSRIQSNFSFGVTQQQNITEMTETSQQTRDEVMEMAKPVISILTGVADAGDAITKLRESAMDGELAGAFRQISSAEHGRGVGVTTMALAGHQSARKIIDTINLNKGFQLSPEQEDEIFDMVGASFGVATKDLKVAPEVAADEREKALSEIPGTNVVSNYNALLAAMEAGDSEAVAKFKAAAQAENQAEIDRLAAEEARLRKEIETPLEAPTYEDILAKAATRYRQPVSPREQMKLLAGKRLAHRAAQQLSNGTPEQKVLLRSAANAVKTLDESGGVLPTDETGVGAFAEDMFRQFSGKTLSMDDIVSTAMVQAEQQHPDDMEKAKDARDAILARFFMLKRQSGQSKKPSATAEAEDSAAQERLLVDRMTPATDADPGAQSTRGREAQRMLQRIANLGPDDALLGVTMKRVARLLPEMSETDAADVRAAAAQALYQQGVSQQHRGSTEASAINIGKAMDQVKELPKDYQWAQGADPGLTGMHGNLYGSFVDPNTQPQ